MLPELLSRVAGLPAILVALAICISLLTKTRQNRKKYLINYHEEIATSGFPI
jgi:hypothetical protein